MQKTIYLLWESKPQSPEARRKLLLDRLANQLADTAVDGLQINICDDLATTPSPAPKPLFTEPFIAQVNIWTESAEARQQCQDILTEAGFELAGYHVDEWLYSDYGDNPHAGPRDWPDGERSPGILAVTLLRKPKRVARDEWMRRWFGHQSPMSEWMQPRTRYVRHVVEEIVTPGAEAIDGIVEEDWPSDEHVTNSLLFYGAKNRLQLIRHMFIMLRSVTRILNLWNITTVMMSEYFIKTPPKAAN
ncbi:MAG: hypothetical protein R3352_00245 [Salinisphaeraceae bacterium]|nr:hypothetical protein [Salinisphaeraceae bacterium]